MRRFMVVLGMLATMLVVGLPAHAHVTATPNEGLAGGFFKTTFRVGHGCEGEPTTTIRIQIPDGVVSVKPQVVPGWDIELTRGPITPFDDHGETVTEGVIEVAWVGGSLPDEYMQEFGLSMRLPDSDAEAVYFPVVQECAQGSHNWIEIPASVAEWGSLDEPAPFVRLTAADGGHGGEDDDAGAAPVGEDDDASPAPVGEDDDAGAAPISEEPVDSDGGDDRDPVAVAALGLSVLALLGSGAAYFRRRRVG